MNSAKERRYNRLLNQLIELLNQNTTPIAKMSTIAALLHHKIKYYFWTGFYLLEGEELFVGPYQGHLACQKLKAHFGVCWAGIDQQNSIIVSDVSNFSGHIACSSLSQSEIVVPVFDSVNKIAGVMDVDSRDKNSFDEIDQMYLEKIVHLIYHEG